jgi:hypothetical protein
MPFAAKKHAVERGRDELAGSASYGGSLAGAKGAEKRCYVGREQERWRILLPPGSVPRYPVC